MASASNTHPKIRMNCAINLIFNREYIMISIIDINSII